MNLILTHEQADFDAIASLFCASKLDKLALAVLPRQINQNVQSFITLYGTEFPFIDPSDLPQENVESVALVDTQSLLTLKGMSKRTSIRVIDHHQRHPSLPIDWVVTIDNVGATTTLLVEALQKQNDHLSAIEATLLLLGIYEDTGFLTFASTTARDAHAVAYLLEEGARLKIAADFYNPQLSNEQRQMLKQLIRSAEEYKIQGYRIIVSTAKMPQTNVHISTVVQKLDILFSPDALFALVLSAEGIRLVARSRSDEISAAEVTTLLGGGGHNHAASALFRFSPLIEESEKPTGPLELNADFWKNHDVPETIEQARQIVLDILPRVIHNALTVAQIMSALPEYLSPATPIKNAIELMKTYQYEGLPVVQNGRVIGLLTRKVAEHAADQNPHISSVSLMDAGEVIVYPNDSVQRLQSIMIDSKWVQIPVVDPRTKAVIGIATRANLLRAFQVLTS